MSIFSLNKHSEKREITPNKMHSNAKIKALKIYNWEETFNRRRNCQNCNYLSSSTATNIRSGIKCRLQTLHRSTLKMDLKNPQQKLNHIPKRWTVECMIQMALPLIFLWENKTRSYIHSFINAIPCGLSNQQCASKHIFTVYQAFCSTTSGRKVPHLFMSSHMRFIYFLSA